LSQSSCDNFPCGKNTSNFVCGKGGIVKIGSILSHPECKAEPCVKDLKKEKDG